MKICSINNNQNAIAKTNIKYNKRLGFRGIVTQNKMKKFVPELGSFIFNSYDISFKNIENFLKRFKPNLKVISSKIDFLPAKATASSAIGLDENLNPYILSNEITINAEDTGTFNEKLLLFECLVHEMTHIYQADLDSDDKHSLHINMDFVKRKFLENPTQDTIDRMNEISKKVYSIYLDLEKRILKDPLFCGFVNSIGFKNDPDKNIENAFYVAFGKTSKDFIRNFVKEKMKALKITEYNFVEKIIHTHAKSEIEAFTISRNAIREILGKDNKQISNSNIMLALYKAILNFRINE